MKKYKIHVAGIQETHICNDKEYTIDGYKFINHGGIKNGQGKATGGVAILIEPELIPFIKSYEGYNGRHLRVTLDSPGNLQPISLLVAYAPHAGYTADEKTRFWKQTEMIIETQIPKTHIFTLMIDANGQVGNENTPDEYRHLHTIGKYTNIKKLKKVMGNTYLTSVINMSSP